MKQKRLDGRLIKPIFEDAEQRSRCDKKMELRSLCFDMELEMEKWLAWLDRGHGQKLSAKEIMARLVNRIWPLVQKHHRRANSR